MTLAQPARWRPRLGLGKLMILVAILCMGLGYWVNEAHRQSAAIAGVERFGGHTYYDRTPVWAPTTAAAWVARVFGENYVYPVTVACPNQTKLAESIPHLRRLSQLERVHFWCIESNETVALLEDSLPGVNVTAKMMR